MKYKPLGDNVLLELHKFNENKIGGIYLPDGAGGDKWYGIVTAMGEGAISKHTIKIGDKVLYDIVGAREVKKNKIVLVGIDYIMCVIGDD